MPDVILLLLMGLLGLVLSFFVVTVFNVGGTSDQSLNRDINQIIIQIAVQTSTTIFLPLKGIWSIVVTLGTASANNMKWVVFAGLFTSVTFLVHYYNAEVLSIVNDGWTCAIVPVMRNVITPLLQIQRVVFALATPFYNAFLIINGQLINAWFYTVIQCSHIKTFRIFTDLAQAVIAFTSSLKNFFGVQNDDPEKNFFVNDFELFQPLNHTSSAVTVFEEALNCACDRFEPVFGIFFAVFREEHAVKALDNLLQSVIRAGQMIFRLLVKDYPDIYLVSFKLEKFAVELGLAMDNLMFHTLESIIKMFTNEFKITKRPTEAVFTGLGQIVAGGIHTVATMGVNGPLSVVGSTFQPDISAFETEVWSIDKAVSFAHRSVYSGAVFTQWLVFIMEKLVTSSFSIDDVFTSEDTPLELNCDWAKDVKEHRYVSVGYTAGCAAYNYGIAYINLAAIVYGASIELLTKSIFTQEQNAFRTLQRWEGPQIARNKVFTCEERTRMSAYDYDTNTYYKEGHLWTQDRSKCNCNRIYGDSMAEGEAYYQPWCGQLNLNFDVFAPMDALVMHLSHGVFGPGFGDAFPFIPPRDNVRMHFTVADREVDKTIPLGMTIPPLTRTSIESLRVLIRVIFSFGDIITGNYFNYPVNCGHGLNTLQLESRFNAIDPLAVDIIEKSKEENAALLLQGLTNFSYPNPAESKTDEELRWPICDRRKYQPVISKKRIPVCEKSNDSPDCMCSYMQPLTPQSKCRCISRYPDLEVTSASQEVGDLIEQRFTSEEVSNHWCNSMIIEWTFQNTAAFANALDFIVSLGPINPTCDVIDRLIDEKTLNDNEPDQRSKSTYLLTSTPTLRFLGQYMDSNTKLNHIKDIYSKSDSECKIIPAGLVNATNEYGELIYEVDANGDITNTTVKVYAETRWSCDASDKYADLTLFDLDEDIEDSDRTGCRIWGRNDFFCSAGLYVRNSKRLSINVARQVIFDSVSLISGNYNDVNLDTLPRMCDFERQQGATAAMIAGLIPKISTPMRQAFAKIINVLLQNSVIFTLRIYLTIANMCITIIQDFIAQTNSEDNVIKAFQSAIDTIIDTFFYLYRESFDTLAHFLNAISPGAGEIATSIVEILDMLSAQLKEGLLDIVTLFLRVIFYLIGALTGDKESIGPFFRELFLLVGKVLIILQKKVFLILDTIYDFFGPVGDFFRALTYGVCMAINGVMFVIDNVAKLVTLGYGIGWEEMTCVKPNFVGSGHGSAHDYFNHSSFKLGKHYLRASDNQEITTRIADTLEWNGTSVCDHFMKGASEYSYTDLRPLEKSKWIECLELKLIGVQIGKFLDSPTFPTDLMYNWKRKYVIGFEVFTAIRIILTEYLTNNKLDWAHARIMLYQSGLDADLYIRLAQKFISLTGNVVSSIEMTNMAEFVMEHIDPQYNNPENPSTTALAYKTLHEVKNVYNTANKEWVEKDMSKQLWSAVDASYEARHHLQAWWASLGEDEPAKQTETERVFGNLKNNIRKVFSENNRRTAKHNERQRLRLPILTGVYSCYQRGSPSWCSQCSLVDNLIETVSDQGSAMGRYYVNEFPDILLNVSNYFNELMDYNADFFEGTFSRLAEDEEDDKAVVEDDPSVRWTERVSEDWLTFFEDFGEYAVNGSHKEIWLGQVDKFLNASVSFVKTNNTDYVPFYGYGFKHMYEFLLFSKCDLEKTIYGTTTTLEQRMQNMDVAIVTCAIILAAIVLNTTWSVIPLFWMTNVVVISFIISFVYMYIVYGYFLACAPTIPYTLVEDINGWYHTRMEPGCFYTNLPYLAINASEDTCLTCAEPQEYINCAEYTIANYQGLQLPLKDLIADYSIAWPALFYVRWQFPDVGKFLIDNGFLDTETTLGKLAWAARSQAPVDQVWIDCYKSMWLDNILTFVILAIGSYIVAKLTIITVQTIVQLVILITYTYTALNYISLAVEQSVIVE